MVKVIPIAVAPQEELLYEAQKKIYPRSVNGPFARWRWGFVFLTQLVFYGLPWLEWGQRQAVLFDLGAGASDIRDGDRRRVDRHTQLLAVLSHPVQMKQR